MKKTVLIAVILAATILFLSFSIAQACECEGWRCPTEEPTEEVTPEPTEEVTPEPTEEVTPEPTEEVTPEPTEEPTEEVTPEPTAKPTDAPAPKSQPWEWPCIILCEENTHEIKDWNKTRPVEGQVSTFQMLTIDCTDPKNFPWNPEIKGYDPKLAENQITVRIRLTPFTAMWGGWLYPATQVENGMWVISYLPDRGDAYLFEGLHSGPFKWEDTKGANPILVFINKDQRWFPVTNMPVWDDLDFSPFWLPTSMQEEAYLAAGPSPKK